MNIAYEISPLLAADGNFGDKSGVYRITFNLIKSVAEMMEKDKSGGQIYLYTINPDLLTSPQAGLYELLKFSHVHLVKYPINFEYALADLPNEEDLIGGFVKRKMYEFKKRISRKRGLTKLLNDLSDQFNKLLVDIVHVSETGYIPIPEMINCITINDLIPFLFPAWQREETILIHQRKLKAALTKCDGVICISENTKNDLQALTEFDNTTAKIDVIYPGVSLLGGKRKVSFNECNEVLVYKGYPRIKQGKYLIFYSTFEPRKNIVMLLYAFLELLKNKALSDYKLLLVGGDGWGDVKGIVSRFISEAYPIKMKSPIILLDYLGDSFLESMISNSRALVYPSLYEGLGMPIIEALQYGIPVITSKVASMPEAGGTVCLYIDPYDPESLIKAMRKIILDNTLYHQLQKQAKTQSDKFDWQRSAQAHLDFYKSLMPA